MNRIEALRKLWSRYDDAYWDTLAEYERAVEGEDKLDKWVGLHEIVRRRARVARWMEKEEWLRSS